jgi:outer membrane protein assembly factor BamE (lipoprotein component of BamABCDE complex)
MSPSFRSAGRFGAVAALCLCLSACGSKVTKSNFEKIKEGMSESEVENILGEPTEKNGNEAMKIASWKADDLGIIIFYQNNKVATKHLVDLEKMREALVEIQNGKGGALDPRKFFAGGNNPNLKPGQEGPQGAFPQPKQEEKAQGQKEVQGGGPNPNQGKTPEPAKPAFNAKFTQANFDRLKVGMTEAQVKAIFGDPPRSSRHADPGNANVQKAYYYYSQGKNSATLDFTDGKLAAKFWYGS